MWIIVSCAIKSSIYLVPQKSKKVSKVLSESVRNIPSTILNTYS
jgi:hypothetical protein